MIYLIPQVTFIFLTQIYYNMNFITWSSNFIKRFPWYFKINLCRLLLEDNFLAHKKSIFLNIPAKLVLRIRNFVKMQGNISKNICSLPTFLKILVFHNFFQIFLTKHRFSNKNRKVSIMLTFMNSKLPDDWQICEDLEFIVHAFYWCIQLDHEID